MDKARPDLAKKNLRNKRLARASFVFLLAILGLFLVFYNPGPVEVKRQSLQVAEVKKGDMKVEISGAGSLVPAEVRWITAQTTGRIEKILVLPGAEVQADTVVMILSNTELIQEADSLALQLKAEKAKLSSLKANLENDLLQMNSSYAQLNSDYKLAVLEAKINRRLFDKGLESELSMRRSQVKQEQLKLRTGLQKKQIESTQKSLDSRMHSEQTTIEQTKARLERINQKINSFKIRAGYEGILQTQSVQEGQQVVVGQALSKVTNPKSLKAVIKISERRAKEISQGQPAHIDTRNSIISGFVTRIDPNVENGTVGVDISFSDKLPQGLRPNQAVEGTIEIFYITDTQYISRPSYAQTNGARQIFKIRNDGVYADRIEVEFGRVSHDLAQIRSGVSVGEKLIISNTSEWESHKTIYLK